MDPKNRRLAFVFLTVIGAGFSIYFLVAKNWPLLLVGILFSIVAAYNTTCGK